MGDYVPVKVSEGVKERLDEDMQKGETRNEQMERYLQQDDETAEHSGVQPEPGQTPEEVFSKVASQDQVEDLTQRLDELNAKLDRLPDRLASELR